MLFLTANGFLNVVSEHPFLNVLTLQTNDRPALNAFTDSTPGIVLVDEHNHKYPYALHVRTDIVAEKLDCLPILFEVEQVHRAVNIKPKAYLFQGYDRNLAGQIELYAREEEVEGIRTTLETIENLAIFPIYRLPSELKSKGGRA